MIVTRFAPSPTGYLHVGGARTALFNWLLARHHGGQFLLRIEDTDQARSTEQACRQLLDDLRWLGLNWDNAELVYQSRRLGFYNAIIDDLLARNLAYRAYETPEELDAMRQEAEQRRQNFVYRRRDVSAEQLRRWEAEGRPCVVRFAMPVREYCFHDVILHRQIAFPPEECQDFVIRKADGMPTYHFAVVVDDAAMNVTHVLRGQEHTKNTFYHIALQEALGYPRPVYGHLPIILNIDGSKMGKRDRDRKIRHQVHLWLKAPGRSLGDLAAAAGLDPRRLGEWLAEDTRQLDLDEQKAVMAAIGLREVDLPEILVHDFRRNGYLPEVLLNFLALLGWSPGGDRERMGVEEMVRLFSLESINKANARFSREKLLAFNTEACAAATPQRLVAAFREYLAPIPIPRSIRPTMPLWRGCWR
jgi:glutamyl/glutaminyl-tRNA synthetase